MIRPQVTRQGLRFLLLLGIVAFAAYNTRNNLLYLMLSVGTASVVVSYLFGLLSLRRLSAVARSAADAYAGTPFVETLQLASSSTWAGALGLELSDGAVRVAQVTKAIPATCRIEHLYRRRGRYRVEGIDVTTSVPLGLFRLSRRVPVGRDLLVYPRVREIDLSIVRARRQNLSASHAYSGYGEEYYRVREYVPGDHAHLVHWKSSAKRGELMVRELGRSESEAITLAMAPSFDPERDESSFEQLVSATASVASHLFRIGAPFRFVADGLAIERCESRLDTAEILRYLAEVQPKEQTDPTFRRAIDNAVSRGDYVLLLADRSAASLFSNVDVWEPANVFAR